MRRRSQRQAVIWAFLTERKAFGARARQEPNPCAFKGGLFSVKGKGALPPATGLSDRNRNGRRPEA